MHFVVTRTSCDAMMPIFEVDRCPTKDFVTFNKLFGDQSEERIEFLYCITISIMNVTWFEH